MEAGDVLWDRRDADLLGQLTRFLESGVVTLTGSAEPQLGAAKLARVLHTLVPQVGIGKKERKRTPVGVAVEDWGVTRPSGTTA